MARIPGPFAAAVVLFCSVVFGSAPALAQIPVLEDRPSLAPMLERVVPGVVSVATTTRVQIENPLFRDPFFRRFFDLPPMQEREVQSLGSGVVVDAENGYVLTNAHVLEQAEEITVILQGGRELPANLVGTDPEADIAVLQVPAENLTAVPVGDSSDLRVGDFVVAIGNPFGLGQTVTSGIVSALGRTGLGIDGFENFIQTDASINPGNSGGALVNLNGELVGINTAILAPAGGNIGIGFAIPIDMARTIMGQLVEFGEVRRGQLGVHVQDLTADLARALGLEANQGAVVARVVPGSPAAEAGLRPGDVVVAVEGQPVGSASELRNMVGLQPIGSQVDLTVIRKGRQLTLTATIAQAVNARLEGERVDERLSGVTLGVIPPGSPQFGRMEGLLVINVRPGTQAWSAGLRQGDVILSVNQQPVASLEALQALRLAKDEPVLLNVMRGDSALFIVIQ